MDFVPTGYTAIPVDPGEGDTQASGQAFEANTSYFVAKLKDIAEFGQFYQRNNGLIFLSEFRRVLIESIDDSRDRSFIDYEHDTLFLVHFFALLCGNVKLEAVVAYCQQHKFELKELFALPNAPSEEAFNRMYERLNIDHIYEVGYNMFTGMVRFGLIKCGYKNLERIPLHLDGKACLGSVRPGFQMMWSMNCVSSETGGVVCQMPILDGHSEAGAIKPLLQSPQCKGFLVTADSKNCKPEVANAIIESGSDYCMATQDKELLAKCLAIWTRQQPEAHKAIPIGYNGETIEIDNGNALYKRIVGDNVLEYAFIAKPKEIDESNEWRSLRGALLTMESKNTDRPYGAVHKLKSLHLCSDGDFDEFVNASFRQLMAEAVQFRMDSKMNDDLSRKTGKAAYAVQLMKKLSLLVLEFATALNVCGKNLNMDETMDKLAKMSPSEMGQVLFSMFNLSSYKPLPVEGKHMSEDDANSINTMELNGLTYSLAARPFSFVPPKKSAQ
ncbi:MAG: transposase family protein [Clostridiales bacterium]|jgi:hypothetical protein|nr:transposase family protein [Clostridiales bacterium]